MKAQKTRNNGRKIYYRRLNATADFAQNCPKINIEIISPHHPFMLCCAMDVIRDRTKKLQ